MADGAAKARRRPLYARLLRLHRLRPGPVLCFIFLEGAIALGVLLALANLASWWTVLALPAAVALMVKLNDIVAGATARQPPVPRVAPEPAEKKIEKPDWPLPGNPSKPLIEDEEDEEDEGEEDEEEEGEDEDTEKTEPPEATRPESDESVTRPAS